MKLDDNRTGLERTTHTEAVVMTDAFMSGWGGATGGKSYAAWAYDPTDTRVAKAVLEWVERRTDARRVRVVSLKGWKPRAVHTHIYAVGPDHPSLASLRRMGHFSTCCPSPNMGPDCRCLSCGSDGAA